MVDWLGPWTGRIGLPAEALPMALLRPLSGSGAYGVLASIVQDPAIGPDGYTGYHGRSFCRHRLSGGLHLSFQVGERDDREVFEIDIFALVLGCSFLKISLDLPEEKVMC